MPMRDLPYVCTIQIVSCPLSVILADPRVEKEAVVVVVIGTTEVKQKFQCERLMPDAA